MMLDRFQSLIAVYRRADGCGESAQMKMVAGGLFLFTSKLQTVSRGVLRCYLL
jgi:hypothetical protein